MIALNSRNQPENKGVHNLLTSKTHGRIQITQKTNVGTTIMTLYIPF